MLNNTFNIKKNIQFFLQNYKTRQSSLNTDEGFTLLELLVATAIMSGVLTIAGIGIVAMLQQNRKALSESDRRANLNRALDYISNEVRMAKSVTAPTVTLPSGAVGVLQLTIPLYSCGALSSDKTYTVVYYTFNSSGLWQLPKSIKRYANITTPVPTPTPCPSPTNTTALSPSPDPVATFADDSKYFIADAVRTPSPTPNPTATATATPTPNPNPLCPSPNTFSGSEGFYACIYTGGKKVDLYLYGKLTETDTTTLEVKSTAVTRAK